MKKLLSMLGVVSVTASTCSVVSCSLVDYTKQSILNKVNSLVQVSSALMRGSMIQNANQELATGLVYDSDYLNSLTLSSKANDLIPDFSTSTQTTLSQLSDTYFQSQNVNRDAINALSSNFLSSNVKSPKSSIDSFSSIFILIAVALKTNGGLHPSLSGLIQGAIPQLGLSDDLADTLNSKTVNQIASIIGESSDSLSQIFELLQSSNIFYSLLKNFFNSEYQNASKDGDDTETQKWSDLFFSEVTLNKADEVSLTHEIANLLDSLVGETLIQDKASSELTGQMIINASLNKLSNVFARSSDKTDMVIASENVYETLGDNFDKNLGIIIGEFFKKFSNEDNSLNTSELISGLLSHPENINDLIFFIGALLKYISSIDFTDYPPTNDTNLFNKTTPNNTFLNNLNNKTLKENPYTTKRLIKNLEAITNVTDDPDGRQLQKLIYMLFNSGKKVTDMSESMIPEVFLVASLTSTGISKKNNYSTLLYGLGRGLAVWQNIVLKGDIGPDQVGNLLRWVLGDGLGYNSDMSGLSKLLEFIDGLLDEPLGITISDETTEFLKKSFDAFWVEDTTLFLDLTGNQTSIYTILNSPLIAGKKISELMELIYTNLSTNDTGISNRAEKLKKGLKIVASSLQDETYTLWYKKSGKFVQFTDRSVDGLGNYNALQTTVLASTRNGLYIKIRENDINENIKGTKAVMYALGTDFDSNGKQIFTSFRNGSLLEGLELVFDDPAITRTLDDISRAFSDIKTIDGNVSTNVYKKMLENENFKTKVISKTNIDNTSQEQIIVYQTVYNDPFTKKSYTYEVTISLKTEATAWQLTSIKRI